MQAERISPLHFEQLSGGSQFHILRPLDARPAGKRKFHCGLSNAAEGVVKTEDQLDPSEICPVCHFAGAQERKVAA
jgi:hypothetical protein